MELIREAGFPKGVVNCITGLGLEVGQPMVDHPDLDKVAFTGSDVAGQKIYESAAKKIIPVTLELGGKSPNIVFEDADFESAVMGAISGILRPPDKPVSQDQGCWFKAPFMTPLLNA